MGATPKPILIDEDYLKKETSIPQNVDWQNIEWAILEAQDMKIEHKTGTALLEEVYTAVNLYGVDFYLSASTEMQVLVEEYIKPALKWSTLHYASVHIWAKPTNKSIAKGTADYQVPLDNSEFIYWRNIYKQWMNERLDRLYNFLCANSNIYPAFLNGNTEIDDIQPDDQNNWGVVFD